MKVIETGRGFYCGALRAVEEAEGGGMAVGGKLIEEVVDWTWLWKVVERVGHRGSEGRSHLCRFPPLDPSCLSWHS